MLSLASAMFVLVSMVKASETGYYDTIISITVGPRAIATRPEGFVSFNIDFTTRPGQPQANVFTTNFSDPRLVALALQLSPAALRISGGAVDICVYQADPSYAPLNCSDHYDPWRVRNESEANCLLVTAEKYTQLFTFAKLTKTRLIFGFNINYGECCGFSCAGHCNGTCDGPCRDWDPSNAMAMLKQMKSENQVPYGVLLGNEEANQACIPTPPLQHACPHVHELALAHREVVPRPPGGSCNSTR